MNGKDKCRILKEIRRQIAEANDIDLVIRECTHQGECRGTCPRCEAEVRYLEEQLEKRRQGRKRVALAGISAGVTMALSGCGLLSQFAQRPAPVAPAATVEPEMLDGDVPMDGPYVDPYEKDGGDDCEPYELEGDVIVEPDGFWDDAEPGEVPPEEEW